MGLLLLVCLLAPLVGTTVADAATGDSLGLSAGSKLLWESENERQADLNAIAYSGAKWVAVDVDWASIEYQNGKYRWAPLDSVVLGAKARGLRVLGILAYSPKWARPADCPASTTHCLPARAEDYAAFAKVVAQRYGNFAASPALRGGISAMQVWNEPNHYPFVQKVNVPFYTYMLKLTFNAVKSADWTLAVLAGGLAPAPDDPNGLDLSPAAFLGAMYLWGGKGSFDAVGHHPYSFPCSPLTEAPWNAFFQTLSLHWVMVANGDGDKKIWGTEVGAPTGADVNSGCSSTGGMSVTADTQASFAAQYIMRWTKDWSAFTGPLFWYQVRDDGTNVWDWEDNMGLLRRDYSVKPAYNVFKMLSQL